MSCLTCSTWPSERRSRTVSSRCGSRTRARASRRACRRAWSCSWWTATAGPRASCPSMPRARPRPGAPWRRGSWRSGSPSWPGPRGRSSRATWRCCCGPARTCRCSSVRSHPAGCPPTLPAAAATGASSRWATCAPTSRRSPTRSTSWRSTRCSGRPSWARRSTPWPRSACARASWAATPGGRSRRRSARAAMARTGSLRRSERPTAPASERSSGVSWPSARPPRGCRSRP